MTTEEVKCTMETPPTPKSEQPRKPTSGLPNMVLIGREPVQITCPHCQQVTFSYWILLDIII